MYGFIIGILLCYSIVVTYIAFLFYKKFKKKITKSDIEDFILDNFLEDF